jgi:hypothetical protein
MIFPRQQRRAAAVDGMPDRAATPEVDQGVLCRRTQERGFPFMRRHASRKGHSAESLASLSPRGGEFAKKQAGNRPGRCHKLAVASVMETAIAQCRHKPYPARGIMPKTGDFHA